MTSGPDATAGTTSVTHSVPAGMPVRRTFRVPPACERLIVEGVPPDDIQRLTVFPHPADKDIFRVLKHLHGAPVGIFKLLRHHLVRVPGQLFLAEAEIVRPP